jgi:hypothetical protein
MSALLRIHGESGQDNRWKISLEGKKAGRALVDASRSPARGCHRNPTLGPILGENSDSADFELIASSFDANLAMGGSFQCSVRPTRGCCGQLAAHASPILADKPPVASASPDQLEHTNWVGWDESRLEKESSQLCTFPNMPSQANTIPAHARTSPYLPAHSCATLESCGCHGRLVRPCFRAWRTSAASCLSRPPATSLWWARGSHGGRVRTSLSSESFRISPAAPFFSASRRIVKTGSGNVTHSGTGHG